MMIVQSQSFKIVLLTLEHKAHLQKNKTNFQYIVKQNFGKKRKKKKNLL